MERDDQDNRTRLLKGRVEFDEFHPNALLADCVTPPNKFSSLALYKDGFGRVYRPRLRLTEEANEAPLDVNVSEHVVCFDCYILPISKKMSREGTSKPPPVFEGDRLVLRVLRGDRGDRETVKEFSGLVSRCSWGRFISITKSGVEKINQCATVGCVELRVTDTFDRSLIIDRAYNLRKFKSLLPA